jgi:hypothetical protein
LYDDAPETDDHDTVICVETEEGAFNTGAAGASFAAPRYPDTVLLNPLRLASEATAFTL